MNKSSFEFRVVLVLKKDISLPSNNLYPLKEVTHIQLLWLTQEQFEESLQNLYSNFYQNLPICLLELKWQLF